MWSHRSPFVWLRTAGSDIIIKAADVKCYHTEQALVTQCRAHSMTVHPHELRMSEAGYRKGSAGAQLWGQYLLDVVGHVVWGDALLKGTLYRSCWDRETHTHFTAGSTSWTSNSSRQEVCMLQFTKTSRLPPTNIYDNEKQQILLIISLIMPTRVGMATIKAAWLGGNCQHSWNASLTNQMAWLKRPAV